jgi:hypothetical protein
LYTTRELLSYRLNTLHNIHYYTSLAAGMRQAVLNGSFERFREEFYRKRGLRPPQWGPNEPLPTDGRDDRRSNPTNEEEK